MKNPRGRVAVNPEGVTQVGDAYAEYIQVYEGYLRQLSSLRDRYAASWGDDDMGKQFSKKFLDGLGNIEQLIGSVKGSLEYAANGLREGGKSYRQADDEARDTSHRLAAKLPQTPNQMVAPGPSSEGQPTHAFQRVAPGPSSEGQPTHAFQMVAPDRGSEGQLTHQLSEPFKRKSKPGKLPSGFESSELPMQRSLSAVPGSGHMRSEVGRPAADAGTESPMVDPGNIKKSGNEPLVPGNLKRSGNEPLVSGNQGFGLQGSELKVVELDNAHVDGEPLPHGYMLQAFQRFPDGTIRFDANTYDSIVPVGKSVVTNFDGRTLDPDGGQFFVVKNNPKFHQAGADYRPLLVKYGPDGIPAPEIPAN